MVHWILFLFPSGTKESAISQRCSPQIVAMLTTPVTPEKVSGRDSLLGWNDQISFQKLLFIASLNLVKSACAMAALQALRTESSYRFHKLDNDTILLPFVVLFLTTAFMSWLSEFLKSFRKFEYIKTSRLIYSHLMTLLWKYCHLNKPVEHVIFMMIELATRRSFFLHSLLYVHCKKLQQISYNGLTAVRYLSPPKKNRDEKIYIMMGNVSLPIIKYNIVLLN